LARGTDETVDGSSYAPVKRVLNLLGQKYTIEMLNILVENDSVRHKDFLETIPNTTLSYRLRGLQETALVTTRPSTSTRIVKEYYLTLLGKQTVQWIRRTKRALTSPAMTKKMEAFKDIKVEYKDAST
jgi:DNA-binding HxlR family transcriptional regulator